MKFKITENICFLSPKRTAGSNALNCSSAVGNGHDYLRIHWNNNSGENVLLEDEKYTAGIYYLYCDSKKKNNTCPYPKKHLNLITLNVECFVITKVSNLYNGV